MRRGSHADTVFSRKGNLVAISTGSDACAEHEGGINGLFMLLCNKAPSEDHVVQQLRLGTADIVYPNSVEARRIIRPENLKLVVTEDKTGAILCSTTASSFDCQHELHFSTYFYSGKYGDEDSVGAWDNDSFAFRVRGVKKVKALQDFYQDALHKHVVFGGTFFRRDSFCAAGVILVNTKYLTKQDKQNQISAQLQYESGLRLRAKNDVPELRQEMRTLANMTNYKEPGYIWVKWKDATEQVMLYCLNPSYNVPADYLGPYTRQQLLDWAKSKFSYHLKSN